MGAGTWAVARVFLRSSEATAKYFSKRFVDTDALLLPLLLPLLALARALVPLRRRGGGASSVPPLWLLLPLLLPVLLLPLLLRLVLSLLRRRLSAAGVSAFSSASGACFDSFPSPRQPTVVAHSSATTHSSVCTRTMAVVGQINTDGLGRWTEVTWQASPNAESNRKAEW